jgi:hypothetical protein
MADRRSGALKEAKAHRKHKLITNLDYLVPEFRPNWRTGKRRTSDNFQRVFLAWRSSTEDRREGGMGDCGAPERP